MRMRTIALILAAVVPLACEQAEPDQEIAEGPDATAIESEPVPEPSTPVGVDAWDQDTDRQLTREEWDAWYGDHDPYREWNTDGQEGLTRDELAAGILGEWDTDGEEGLTESEWDQGISAWWSGPGHGSWDDWDVNADGTLDADEVAGGLERENLLGDIDRNDDNRIDDEELADWRFTAADVNHDDRIDASEWNRFERNAGGA